MKKVLIIAIMLMQVGKGFIVQAQQINIRKYNIEDGLVNNDILNIYQDGRGFIWLCTRGGLSCYDGSRFTNYTTDNGLTHDMINDIVEIAPQEFIVAQNSGGPCLLKNDRIRALMPDSKIILSNFYKLNNSRLVATADNKGMVEWDRGVLKLLNPAYAKTTSKIAVLNDSVWLVLDLPFSIQLTTSFLQPISPFTRLNVTTAFTDSRHRTWIGTTNGLKLLDPVIQTGKPIAFIPLPPLFDLPVLREAFITDFMEDSQGNYWIGTMNGLVKVDKYGKLAVYTQQDGLPASVISCIKEDNQNNIWIGTSVGLARFSLNNELKTFSPNPGFSNTGVIVASPVTETMLRLFDGKRISNLDLLTGRLVNDSLVNSSGYRLYRPDKERLLLINSRKGTIYHAGKEQVEMINWPDIAFAQVISIDQYHFLGTYSNKLFVVSNGHYVEKLTIGHNANSGLTSLKADKNGCLWAGTWENGLFKLSMNSKDDSLQLKVIDTFAGRLPDQHIRSLYADRDNELWIGTRHKGVVRLLELPDGKYEIQHYGTNQGLISNFVHTISRDSTGNIWVGTAQGLDKLIPAGNQYRVFNFGRVNRLFSRAHDITFLNNHYLLATGYPLIVHALDMQQDTLPPPPVYITSIRHGVNDTIVAGNEGPTRLPYNKAQIYFEFSAPQFINENFTGYSYRLLGGSDTNWNVSGKSHSIYFASLRPGRYTFEVRALGFNGQWGKSAVYGFIVNAPFWQKAWFIALMIAVVGLLAYALYRYRIQQLIRLQKVRNRIATDLHDEIGSNLTNISILSNLSKTNLSEPGKAVDFLQRISEEVSSSSQALDDIIWSVDSSNDLLEETVARMRRYAAELFDSANISYDLYLDPAFEGKKLLMEQRRDVYLLYKEAVNNIFKHAGAKQVSIRIAIEHNQLLLHIKDDGKGFDTSKESGRHGLKGMKERVKKWKGKITIESGADKGTSLQIRLPVSK